MRSSRSPHANDRWSQTAPARHRTAATRRGRGADSPVSPSCRGTRMLHRLFALLAGALALIAAFAAVGLRAAEATPPQPEIFAPGAISGPAGIDCLTFAPDGATVYFDQQAGASGFVMEAHRTGDGWSAPRIAPFSGQWLDHDPAMAPDGSYLVFTSNRPDEAGHAFHLYRSAWRDGRHQPPQRLALGDAAEEQDPAIAPDGSFLVFDANYTDKDQPDHLYLAFRDGDGWRAPIDLGDAVDRYQPWGSHLGPDGRTLYFTSNRTEPVHYPRSPAQARADLARMRAWDNGNNHIWRLSLAPWLAAHHAA